MYAVHIPEYMADCYDVKKETNTPTGVYSIKPRGLNEVIQVQCDMGTDDGGWTVKKRF